MSEDVYPPTSIVGLVDEISKTVGASYIESNRIISSLEEIISLSNTTESECKSTEDIDTESATLDIKLLSLLRKVKDTYLLLRRINDNIDSNILGKPIKSRITAIPESRISSKKRKKTTFIDEAENY